MELRQLEYVLALADHGSFTRAARAVHVAQPSVSESIRLLERELGVELFHRLPRGIAPTPSGDALVVVARQVLRDVATARAAVAAIAGVDAGRLDLVALPTLAVDPVAGWVGSFRQDHPGVRIGLIEREEGAAVVDAVRSGRAEIGITEMRESTGDADLSRIPVLVQEMKVVFPPGSPRKRRVLAQDLASVLIIATPKGTSTRRLVDEAFLGAHIEPDVVVETTQRDAIVALVLAGAGVAVMPPGIAEGAAARGAVVAKLDPPARRNVGLVHRTGPLSPAAARFVRHVVEAA